MALFDWDSGKYSVYIDEMDTHHKKLMSLINSIYDASKNPPNKASNTKLFDEIINYTLMHFETEEKIMEKMGFPDIKTHKFIHKDLVSKVVKFREEYDKGPGAYKPEFVNFLKVWLTAHIQGIDRKYGEYSKTHKSAA